MLKRAAAGGFLSWFLSCVFSCFRSCWVKSHPPLVCPQLTLWNLSVREVQFLDITFLLKNHVLLSGQFTGISLLIPSNFFFNWSIVDLQCLKCTAKQFNYIHIYMYNFFRFSSIIGYYKLLKIVPCAEQVGSCCLFILYVVVFVC